MICVVSISQLVVKLCMVELTHLENSSSKTDNIIFIYLNHTPVDPKFDCYMSHTDILKCDLYATWNSCWTKFSYLSVLKFVENWKSPV